VQPTLTWAQLQALGIDAAQPFQVSVVVSDGYNPAVASPPATVAVSKAQPVFSQVSAPVVTDGIATVTLSGMILAGVLVPPGRVTVTINGVSECGPINADGTFQVVFPTAALPTGAYQIQYDYAGSANFQDAHAVATLDLTDGILILSNQGAREPGSTIPIQIELIAASGQDVSSPNVTVTALGIAATTDTADTTGAVDPADVGTLLAAQAAGDSNPANVFRLQGGQQLFYMYNLQTAQDMAAGTYRLYFQVQGDPLWHWVTFTLR
jgi:hypothetical protein